MFKAVIKAILDPKGKNARSKHRKIIEGRNYSLTYEYLQHPSGIGPASYFLFLGEATSNLIRTIESRIIKNPDHPPKRVVIKTIHIYDKKFYRDITEENINNHLDYDEDLSKLVVYTK